MMENRAYEDEANKSSAHHQQHPHLQHNQHHLNHHLHHQDGHFSSDPPPPINNHPQQQYFMPQRFEVYRGMSQHTPDCHVYEDIVTPYGLALEPGGGFHRNLTLPLRRTNQSCELIDTNPTSSSVRVTNKERGSVIERLTRDNCESSRDESSLNSSAERPARRRRKKDCKHCKVKTCSSATNSDEFMNKQQQEFYAERSAELRAIFGLPDLEVCRLGPPPGCLNGGIVYAIGCNGTDCNGTLLSNSVEGTPIATTASAPTTTTTLTMPRFGQEGCTYDDKTLITSAKSNNGNTVGIGGHVGSGGGGGSGGRQAGMKVNSIYAQEHWQHTAKDPRIFLNDPKEQNSPFQRAYSAVSSNSPSSENRANLRRSVRDEPAPHPARLRKHRHGWTLHFGRPLSGTTCTKSLVLLLIVVLALLGIGGIALYIVFEPEKLHVIQQYLRSSARNSSLVKNGTNILPIVTGNEIDEQGYYPTSIPTSPLLDTLINGNGNNVPGNDNNLDDTEPIFVTTWTTGSTATIRTSTLGSSPAIDTMTNSPISTTTTIAPRPISNNFPDDRKHRPCDECRGDEVCVARNADETPYCRQPLDLQDTSGCAGLCDDKTQKCHKLDGGAFRCTEIEHHCLDDEWTCLNIFCIPLVKRCDGQMNCYDHSDEYNCECNLETHFHCGNQTSCLPLSKKCDGHVDCFDATDEENCTTICPSKDEYTCRNKQQCIRRTRFCDGYRDCKDGSDEPHGCQGRCNKHEFTCHNGRCINKGDKCNGIDDCGDGSDEQHCRERL